MCIVFFLKYANQNKPLLNKCEEDDDNTTRASKQVVKCSISITSGCSSSRNEKTIVV
jgi:hypothetical protein